MIRLQTSPSEPTQINQKEERRKQTVTLISNQDNKISILTPHKKAEIIRSGNYQFQNLGSVDAGIGTALTKLHKL